MGSEMCIRDRDQCSREGIEQNSPAILCGFQLSLGLIETCGETSEVHDEEFGRHCFAVFLSH